MLIKIAVTSPKKMYRGRFGLWRHIGTISEKMPGSVGSSTPEKLPLRFLDKKLKLGLSAPDTPADASPAPLSDMVNDDEAGWINEAGATLMGILSSDPGALETVEM